MSKHQLYSVGDRVRLKNSGTVGHIPAFGQVVYRHGLHDPKNPRVRWTSGWGTTHKSKDLAPLTPAEAAANPVQLCEVDHPRS